ncbi:MAG: HIT domain-containing protein [Candidatus Eiseniibacteriota bacterium]
MTDVFQLDERLRTDTVEVDRWDLSLVLLMNDATYPWLILVPQRPNLRDFHDLVGPDLLRLTAEIVRASNRLIALFPEGGKPDKMNVAALGNQVPQLHVHVVARFVGDAAWPKPVWGVAPARPYGEKALAERLRRLRGS